MICSCNFRDRVFEHPKAPSPSRIKISNSTIALKNKHGEFVTQIINHKKGSIMTETSSKKNNVIVNSSSNYRNMKMNKGSGELVATKTHEYQNQTLTKANSNISNSNNKKRISRSSILNKPEAAGKNVSSAIKNNFKSQDMENGYSPSLRFKYRLNNHNTQNADLNNHGVRDFSTGLIRNHNLVSHPLAISKDKLNSIQNQNRSVQSKSVYGKDIKLKHVKVENTELKSKIANVVSRTDTGLNLTNQESK